MAPRFSIVIPARDEEHYLPQCLDSIDQAAAPFPGQVEVVVVVNRCTDRTEEIARARGATVVRDDSRCLAKIRNAGVRAATGEILLTLDADSTMSAGVIADVDRLLASGRYIGGGVRFSLDRRSFLLRVMLWLVHLVTLTLNVGGICIWCLRRDFWAIGGFDEQRLSFEDVDFVLRLKRHGKAQGKRFKIILSSSICTSARKFDLYGDWYLLRHPGMLLAFLRGVDQETADRLWYEFPRQQQGADDVRGQRDGAPPSVIRRR